MSPRWDENSFAKIHEHCGGLVRWVEAYDRPGVGYTGECIDCGREGIPVEEIIPLRAPDGQTGVELVTDVSKDRLGRLEWDEDVDWEANQERLRKEVQAHA